MNTYEIGAITEQELLDQGMAGSNIGYGDTFVMPGTTSVVMEVSDNDSYLSGDSWHNENANDWYGQTATITENGTVTSSGHQIYAECYYWVQDQNGKWYIMIEIESEGTNDDYFSFYGRTPPEGSVLTVKCGGNVWCDWVNYNCLTEPNSVAPPLANDDALTISEDETGGLNVLDNDVDVDGDVLSVTSVEGGEVGQPFEVFSSEGYSAMVTLDADGALTIVPGPEFEQLTAGQTTTISFDYTITDADGLTATATVTVQVNGETTLDAADDAIIVKESEGAGDADGNVLANDTIDGVQYSGDVAAVEGDAANVGTWIDGSNGGRIKINADGSFDFDADGDFDALNEGQLAETTFSYQISSTGEVLAAEKQNILFVVDVSGSTAPATFAGGSVGDLNNDGMSNTILDAQIASYLALSQQIADMNIDPSMVNIGVVTFSTHGQVVGTFQPGSAELEAALTGLRDGGLTNFDDALDKSIDWFGSVGAQSDDNNVMFFLSDGMVNEDGTNFTDEMATLEGTYGVSSIAVGVGNNADLGELNSIDNTGGAEIVTTTDALTAELSNALTEVVDITDTATITVTVEGESNFVAIADTMTVFASEAGGDADLLDGDIASVLANDLEDTSAYAGSVEAVSADAALVGTPVAGSNGGLLTINADGTVDFDANGEFDNLLDGQSAQTTFNYTIAGGKSATVTVTVNGETVREAVADEITVLESETAGDAETLDSGAASVLANDIQNGGAYTDNVGSVNGSASNVNAFVAGSNGGLLKVNADGTVDFDANGEFEALTEGQTAQTTFTYTLISGEEATITVNVEGETDYDAVDDVLTVKESEAGGDLEVLDSGASSVLANDTQDGGAYAGNVEGNAGVQVVGSNGGLATIFADGTIDFDANDEFDYLAAGETAQTVFSYEIAGGETANLTVNVEGEDDPASGGTLNIAIMLNSATSMYATAQGTVFGIPAYPDVNGDDQANQLMDMAYWMLNDFINDAFDDAAAAGVTLNLALIGYDQLGVGENAQYWSVNNEASWDGQLQAKVSVDNSADYGKAFNNANAWFDTVTSADATNAVFVIGDGFTTGAWETAKADLLAEHNAQIDAYFPDLDFGSAGGVAALNAMDKDGFADQIYTDDPNLSFGAPTVETALDIANYI